MIKAQWGYSTVAVKVMNDDQYLQAQQEADLLYQAGSVKQELFVQLLGVCRGKIPEAVRVSLVDIGLSIPKDSEKIGLVLQYGPGGTLDQALLPSHTFVPSLPRFLSKRNFSSSHSYAMGSSSYTPPGLCMEISSWRISS